MATKVKPGAADRKAEGAPASGRGSKIEPERLYTYGEMSEFFGVRERHVRRWVEEGRLAYTPLPGGRGRRISGRQYLRYLDERAVEVEKG